MDGELPTTDHPSMTGMHEWRMGRMSDSPARYERGGSLSSHRSTGASPALTHRAWLCCENERGRTRLLSRQRVPTTCLWLSRPMALAPQPSASRPALGPATTLRAPTDLPLLCHHAGREGDGVKPRLFTSIIHRSLTEHLSRVSPPRALRSLGAHRRRSRAGARPR